MTSPWWAPRSTCSPSRPLEILRLGRRQGQRGADPADRRGDEDDEPDPRHRVPAPSSASSSRMAAPRGIRRAPHDHRVSGGLRQCSNQSRFPLIANRGEIASARHPGRARDGGGDRRGAFPTADSDAMHVAHGRRGDLPFGAAPPSGQSYSLDAPRSYSACVDHPARGGHSTPATAVFLSENANFRAGGSRSHGIKFIGPIGRTHPPDGRTRSPPRTR